MEPCNQLWKCGDRKTTGRETWGLKHPDGTLELWRMERVRVLHPSRESFAKGLFSVPKVVPKSQVRNVQTAIYSMSQFFHEPGDRYHANGQMVDGIIESTYRKNLRTLRSKGLKIMTDAQVSAAMPT